MHQGRTVFAQIMELISHNEFNRCLERYDGNQRVRRLTCWDQFLAMAFAQLTYRESLRDIEVCLGAHHNKLYHCGLSAPIKRSTLAEANENRDWRIYSDLAHSLISVARTLYADVELGIDLDATVYALDSTTIDLCLALFPWAVFRRAKGAIKLHTMMEVPSSIPVFIHITHGKTHDLRALDVLVPEPGTFIVMDKGYVDFLRLYSLHLALTFFVVRPKKDLQFRRRYSRPVDKSTGLRSDQTILLTGPKSQKLYPDPLRRVSYFSEEIDKYFVFLTNNFNVSALTITQLYHKRWQIELFFKWIKQHLRIKQFFGTSLNSVKTQIWISICVYVLIAILKKRLALRQSVYTILQVLSLSLFEKKPILSLFDCLDDQGNPYDSRNQLILFEI
ncbi:MAG: IS4 family transposase [Acidobacteria bacterium]|nr:MAG: IS4 family transposase [Acidobacteriota bacterium]